MKKRILTIALVLCLLIALTVPAMAADIGYPVTGGKISFDPATGTITNCEETVTEAIIPSLIQGIPVVAIGKRAFARNQKLEKVSIPDSVVSIGEDAFFGCGSLKEISLGNGVTSIGKSAFYGCDILETISIPDSVVRLDSWIFADCSALKSVRLGRNVTSIPECMFYDCFALQEITVPKSVTVIENSAFSGCESLPSIVLPDSVVRIKRMAFDGCKKLSSIKLGNCLEEIGGYAFRLCGLTEVIFPESIAKINESVFSDCRSLKTVVFRDGISYIPSSMFAGCSNLTSVSIPSSITEIRYNAFGNCNSLMDVYYTGSLSEWSSITVDSYNKPLGTATVHFNSSIQPDVSVAVSAVSLSQSLASLRVGRRLTLLATVSPADADNPSVTWASSNVSVAAVDSTGIVTAIAPGTVTITVTSSDGGYSAFCVVTVKDAPSYVSSEWAESELEEAEVLDLFPESLQNSDLRDPITREEFAAVAVRTFEALYGGKAIPSVINPFSDTSDIEVLKAYQLNIVVGMSDTVFAPDALLNREQCATMLTRVFKRITLPGWSLATDSQYRLDYRMPTRFADDADISDWARDSVYFMVANNIILGVGKNRFAPRNTTTEQEAQGYANATREQALIIAKRMVENLR